jgi:hypothetical protein
MNEEMAKRKEKFGYEEDGGVKQEGNCSANDNKEEGDEKFDYGNNNNNNNL